MIAAVKIVVLVLYIVYVFLGNYFMNSQRIRKVSRLRAKDFSSYSVLRRLGICCLEVALWPYFLWRIKND